ncbi:MAG TPA: DUF1579 family protein [Steroidobacteraceae bacterium]|jgi:hypothetical protein|nr:DUF1579 family protein [Steroidobacteraceae bacterium]
MNQTAIFATLLSIFAAGAGTTLGAEPARAADDAYLDALQGTWNMTGTLLGKPVRYHARAQRILQGGFVRLHMIDVAPVPSYEADLFIGYDPKAKDYIGHWLDRFGAAGSRVVATGKREGQTLTIQFPYADAAFKDTFVFDPRAHTWSLTIESQTPGGAWSNFATYTLVHPANEHAH